MAIDTVEDRFAARTVRVERGPAGAQRLAGRLRERGERLAVLVPARDEAATVGDVVRAIAPLTVAGSARGADGATSAGAPLVDELVVIDGDSTDATVAEATSAGARVVQQGAATGKGAALALGLAETHAELVVTIDADLTDPGPDTVVALASALADDDTAALVKAAYDRPLSIDGHVRPTGGGRVTELMARPLIAALWPELAWLVQPLAGEWGVRRERIAGLALEPGYGVELGLVLDVAREHGVGAIAQVDLGARAHRHHDLATLGRMATEVLGVALDRLSREGRLDAEARAALGAQVTLWQPQRTDGALALEAHRVRLPEVHD